MLGTYFSLPPASASITGVHAVVGAGVSLPWIPGHRSGGAGGCHNRGSFLVPLGTFLPGCFIP